MGGTLSCPSCRVALALAPHPTGDLHRCAKCHGIWVDADTFQRVIADRHAHAAGVLRRRTMTRPQPSAPVMLPCAACAGPMYRFHYGGDSGIHLDTCRDHGIWFEGDELLRVIEYAQRGGLAASLNRRYESPPVLEAGSLNSWWYWDSWDTVYLAFSVLDLFT